MQATAFPGERSPGSTTQGCQLLLGLTTCTNWGDKDHRRIGAQWAQGHARQQTRNRRSQAVKVLAYSGGLLGLVNPAMH